MKLRDALWLGSKGIRERKTRAAITILTVIVGVASIIALVSQTTGIQVSIVNTLSSLGPTSILVTGSRTGLTQVDVAKMLSIPYVETVIPIINTQMSLSKSTETKVVSVVGINSEGLQSLIGDIKLVDGTVYEATVMPLAVVGHNIAFSSSSQDIYVGQPLLLVQQVGQTNIKMTLQVVGLLDKYGSSPFLSADDSIFVPIDSMLKMLNRRTYTLLLVKVVDTAHVSEVETLLGNIYGNSVTILTIATITQAVSSIIGLLSILLGSIAAISLSVAGLGIMNIMLVSVYERIHEIGIMKAIGFKDRNILTLFLSESAIIGIVGGIIGILTGAGVSQIIPILLSAITSSTFQSSSQNGSGGGGQGGFSGAFGGGFNVENSQMLSYTPIVTPDIAIIALIIAVAVSIIAGLYPAWRASRMEPIKALRHE